jgi:hypothetical protein
MLLHFGEFRLFDHAEVKALQIVIENVGRIRDAGAYGNDLQNNGLSSTASAGPRSRVTVQAVYAWGGDGAEGG